MSATKLQEHKQHKHAVISWYPCDHCGHKAANVEDLDAHIGKYHGGNMNNGKLAKQNFNQFKIRPFALPQAA